MTLCVSLGFHLKNLFFGKKKFSSEKNMQPPDMEEKNQRGTFSPKRTTSLRKLLLLHNLSRINTHDKFTLEDAVITEMIGSKLRIFFKSRDARYRSLARVSLSMFLSQIYTFQPPPFRLHFYTL